MAAQSFRAALTSPRAVALYLHVPFCAALCDYCDFYSEVPADDRVLDPYVDRLLADLARSQDEAPLGVCPSLYIGGGTPTSLGARRLERLLSGLARRLPAWPAELTLEANPESLDADALSAAAAGGVNRLSLGVQSFDAAERMAVGRRGGLAAVEKALGLVGRSWRGRLSIDLMAGLPGQSQASLAAGIARAVAAGAEHISLYSLILEEDTPLAARVRRKQVLLPPPDAADELWLAGRSELCAAGFRQYETSNFARPGAECRHNLVYWNLGDWRGFGAAAVGMEIDAGTVPATARRRTEAADYRAYLAGEPAAVETVGPKELIEESFLMGWRLAGGLDTVRFRRRFGAGPEEFVGASLGAWGVGPEADGRLALPGPVALTLDRFLVDCFAELDSSYPRYADSRR